MAEGSSLNNNNDVSEQHMEKSSPKVTARQKISANNSKVKGAKQIAIATSQPLPNNNMSMMRDEGSGPSQHATGHHVHQNMTIHQHYYNSVERSHEQEVLDDKDEKSGSRFKRGLVVRCGDDIPKVTGLLMHLRHQLRCAGLGMEDAFDEVAGDGWGVMGLCIAMREEKDENVVKKMMEGKEIVERGDEMEVMRWVKEEWRVVGRKAQAEVVKDLMRRNNKMALVEIEDAKSVLVIGDDANVRCDEPVKMTQVDGAEEKKAKQTIREYVCRFNSTKATKEELMVEHQTRVKIAQLKGNERAVLGSMLRAVVRGVEYLEKSKKDEILMLVMEAIEAVRGKYGGAEAYLMGVYGACMVKHEGELDMRRLWQAKNMVRMARQMCAQPSKVFGGNDGNIDKKIFDQLDFKDNAKRQLETLIDHLKLIGQFIDLADVDVDIEDLMGDLEQVIVGLGVYLSCCDETGGLISVEGAKMLKWLHLEHHANVCLGKLTQSKHFEKARIRYAEVMTACANVRVAGETVDNNNNAMSMMWWPEEQGLIQWCGVMWDNHLGMVVECEDNAEVAEQHMRAVGNVMRLMSETSVDKVMVGRRESVVRTREESYGMGYGRVVGGGDENVRKRWREWAMERREEWVGYWMRRLITERRWNEAKELRREVKEKRKGDERRWRDGVLRWTTREIVIEWEEQLDRMMGEGKSSDASTMKMEWVDCVGNVVKGYVPKRIADVVRRCKGDIKRAKPAGQWGRCTVLREGDVYVKFYPMFGGLQKMTLDMMEVMGLRGVRCTVGKMEGGYGVCMTEAVEGATLQEALTRKEGVGEMDMYWMSKVVMATCVLQPGDDNPTNLIVEEIEGGKKGKRLVFVDAEQSFAHTAVEDGMGRRVVEMKSIVLMMDEMENEMDERAMEEMGKMDVEGMVEEWTQMMEVYGRGVFRVIRSGGLFDGKDVKRMSERERCVMLVTMPVGCGRDFCFRMKRMVGMMRERKPDEKWTCMDVVCKMHAEIGAMYRKAFEAGRDAASRWKALPSNSEQGKGKGGAIFTSRPHMTVEELVSLDKGCAMLSAEQMKAEMKDAMKMYDEVEREGIGMGEVTFTRDPYVIAKILKRHAVLMLDKTRLDTLKLEELGQLELPRCHLVDETMLSMLAKKAPHIQKLDVSECQALKELKEFHGWTESLRELRCRGCWGLKVIGYEAGWVYSGLVMKAIKLIDASDCELLEGLMMGCRGHVKIVLDRCNRLKDLNLWHVAGDLNLDLLINQLGWYCEVNLSKVKKHLKRVEMVGTVINSSKLWPELSLQKSEGNHALLSGAFIEIVCSIEDVFFIEVELLEMSCVDALDFSNLYATDETLKRVSRACKDLKSLNLSRCGHITDAGLKEIGAGCKQLTDLDLSDCKQITDEGLKDISAGCKLLINLNFSRCNLITDAGLKETAGGCEKLIDLKLQRCWQITDTGLKEIGRGCKHLTNLDLSNCYMITNTGLKDIGACHQLRNLSLYGCNLITDAGLKEIGSGCKQLTSLNLYFCEQITDGGLRDIVAGCNQLTNVNLYGCNLITDTGLKDISASCYELTSLILYRCSKITDAGLKDICEKCNQLTSLSLYGCKQITDAGLKEISEGCNQLTSLNLYYCEQISDRGLKMLATGCKLLTNLDLSGCIMILDAGLKEIAAGCKRLSDLNLSGCRQVTRVGLKEIGAGWRKS